MSASISLMPCTPETKLYLDPETLLGAVNSCKPEKPVSETELLCALSADGKELRQEIKDSVEVIDVIQPTVTTFYSSNWPVIQKQTIPFGTITNALKAYGCQATQPE